MNEMKMQPTKAEKYLHAVDKECSLPLQSTEDVAAIKPAATVPVPKSAPRVEFRIEFLNSLRCTSKKLFQ